MKLQAGVKYTFKVKVLPPLPPHTTLPIPLFSAILCGPLPRLSMLLGRAAAASPACSAHRPLFLHSLSPLSPWRLLRCVCMLVWAGVSAHVCLPVLCGGYVGWAHLPGP